MASDGSGRPMSSSWLLVEFMAALYVLSGVSQPLIMTLCKSAGLADPTAQLYMVPYYVGPALIVLTVRDPWPSASTCLKAVGITLFDITAQAMNYTGTTLAGPTIFAIVYSSVTVWTAVWARWLLDRRLNRRQWAAVAMVFGGLTVTAVDASHTVGSNVLKGTLLVVVGSALHAGSYVWSEIVMVGSDGLSPGQNTAIQGLVAGSVLSLWQLVYTVPRWDRLMGEPMAVAGTSVYTALYIMGGFALANLLHCYSFFFTIKHYKGGSVIAGVFKGLQAALVFGASHLLFCGRTGGMEMCYTPAKFVSLVVVVAGVVLFSVATPPSGDSSSAAGSLVGEQKSLLSTTATEQEDSASYATVSTGENA